MVSRLGETILAELRERFVERALGLPLEQLERAGSGDLTARVTNDVSVVAEGVREALPELGRSVLTVVLTLGALAVLDWRFFLAALIAVPIQLWTVRWYVPRAKPLYASQREAVGAQQQQLLDTIGGAKTVRAFSMGDAHIERVRKRSDSAVELALRGIRLVTRFYARLNLAEFVGLSAILAMGFLLVGADAVTVGVATAAALYFHSLFGPITTALALVDDAQAAAASLARLIGVADLPAEAQPAQPGRPLDASVKTAGAGYSYVDGHPVLREIDLGVAPGEQVALVGASGAGKTTLAKLIAGIHRPGSGSVTLGGVPLDELGPEATRRTVALISQEVHVFAGPLAEDLRLARPSASDDDLRAALTKVGALTWAEALPEGLATVVGEGGHQLTVTQAQQLALVRLVLADPPIAILDEATAEAGSAGSASWSRRPRRPWKAARHWWSPTASPRRRRPTASWSWTRARSSSRAPTTSWWPRTASTPSSGRPGPASAPDDARQALVRRLSRRLRSARPGQRRRPAGRAGRRRSRRGSGGGTR